MRLFFFLGGGGGGGGWGWNWSFCFFNLTCMFSAVHFSVLIFFILFPQFCNWFRLLGVSFCNFFFLCVCVWSFYFFVFFVGFLFPHPHPFYFLVHLGVVFLWGRGGVPQPLSTALLQRRRTVLTENICRGVQHFSTTTPFVGLCCLSFLLLVFYLSFLLS